MTIENLQEALNKENISAKVLHVEKTDYDDYEVIYTFDLNYMGRDYSNVDSIIEPERDELVKDIEDAVSTIGLKYRG